MYCLWKAVQEKWSRCIVCTDALPQRGARKRGSTNSGGARGCGGVVGERAVLSYSRKKKKKKS